MIKKYYFFPIIFLLALAFCLNFVMADVDEEKKSPCPWPTNPNKGKACVQCKTTYCAKDWYDKPFCYGVAACIGAKYGGSSTLCYNAPYLDNNGNCFFDSEQCHRWTLYLSKTYGSACGSNDDCFKGCPSDKPDWPHMKCDNKNKKCVVVKSCGKSECENYIDCCKVDEKFPHYVCDAVDYMDGKVWQCWLDYSCGKNECDPKKTKYSSDLGLQYNLDCRSYECKISDSAGQCIISNKGKYPNRLFCEENCKTTTSTTIPITTTTVTTIPKGTTTTTTKGVVPGGDTSTTTTTKPIISPTTTRPSFCRISAFEFVSYTEGGLRGNAYKSLYALLNIPGDKILKNPKLEYAASYCEQCDLDIVNLDTLEKVEQFYLDNSSFGKLERDWLTDSLIENRYTSKNRYTFERSTFYQNGLKLRVRSLHPGKYELTLKCIEPDDRSYDISRTLRLNVFPTIRWRESLPAMN